MRFASHQATQLDRSLEMNRSALGGCGALDGAGLALLLRRLKTQGGQGVQYVPHLPFVTVTEGVSDKAFP